MDGFGGNNWGLILIIAIFVIIIGIIVKVRAKR